MAIVLGIMLAIFSWQVKPLPWKYTFTYSYLPHAVIDYLDSPESLRMIPLIVLIAFESMFIYALISPLASIFLLISIIPVLDIRFVTTYMNIYLPAIFLLAILMAALSRRFAKGEKPFLKLRAMDKWGLVFLFYLWGSLGRAHSLRIGLKEIFSLTTLFMAYFSIRLFSWDKEKFSKLSKWLAWIGGLVGGQAVLHFYLMKRGFLALYEERFFRAYTSFGDPTLLANFLIMVIPLVGIFYFRARANGGEVKRPSKNVLQRRTWGLMLLVMVVALFLTFSRSAWISLGLTLALLILVRLRGLKKMISILILVIMVAGFVAMSKDKYVVNDQLDINNRLRSIYARKDIIFYALRLVRQAPVIGIGPGNFSYFNTEYDTRDMVNTTVPNTYLHTLVISGVLGLGSLLTFLALIVRSGFRIINKSGLAKDGLIISGLYIGVMANLIHGLFENIFYNIISNWIFGLILGLLAARPEGDSSGEKWKSRS